MIPKTRHEALNLIRTNGWFSFKELMNELDLNYYQVKYLFNDKFKIKLKEEFKDWLYEKFTFEETPKYIHKVYPNIPLHTIYHHYRQWRKEPKNKTGVTKRQITKRMKACNYCLNEYSRKYDASPDKIKQILRSYGLLEWFYKKQKELGIRKPVENRKYKKGELKKKAFDFFNKYPVSLNYSGSKLALVLNCDVRNANRLKKLYKKEKGIQ